MTVIPMSEVALLNQVREIAKLYGWLMYHTHNSRRSAPGFPDCVFVHPTGRLIFRELKSSKGRVRPEQKVWLEALCAAGQDAGIWRPEDLRSGAVVEALRVRRAA